MYGYFLFEVHYNVYFYEMYILFGIFFILKVVLIIVALRGGPLMDSLRRPRCKSEPKLIIIIIEEVMPTIPW